VGYPGSVHVNCVWPKTDQCLHYHHYFSWLQSFLADSAFMTSTHLIAAFKWFWGVMNLPENCELFNTYLVSESKNDGGALYWSIEEKILLPAWIQDCD
jgi:hypothetical protein